MTREATQKQQKGFNIDTTNQGYQTLFEVEVSAFATLNEVAKLMESMETGNPVNSSFDILNYVSFKNVDDMHKFVMQVCERMTTLLQLTKCEALRLATTVNLTNDEMKVCMLYERLLQLLKDINGYGTENSTRKRRLESTMLVGRVYRVLINSALHEVLQRLQEITG